MTGGPWWRIAWRNLGRNRRRTAITASALAFGYMAVVIMIGLSKGLVAEMIENGTGLIEGQLQVHAPDYLPDRSLYETIGGDGGADVPALLSRVEADPDVVAATPRVFGSGLVSSGASTSAAILVGVDTEREPRVSRLAASLYRGRLPAPGSRQMAIGTEMARRLDASIGTELVVVAPAADGSLGNDLYTVSGVFETGMPELDGTYALLSIRSLQTLLALSENRIHEIAAATTGPWLAPAVAERLAARLPDRAPPLDLDPWTELRPDMVEYAQLAESSNWIIIVIIFGMATFGVANTMLMATFERRREFAVLMALGTTGPAIVRTVVYEALALGLVSLTAGAALAAPLAVWWHHAPPDLSGLVGGFTIAGGLVRPVLRVEYAPVLSIWSGVALLVTAVAAALYPALRSSRVPPADALARP